MTNLKKYSFTLIEIIIAMIVVGIAVTAIPMLLNTSSDNLSTSLKEDSFFNAYSTISLIQTLNWDENNTKNDNYYKVLTSFNGDSELKCERKGTKQLDNKSGGDCSDDTVSYIGIDNGEDKDDVTTFDDIDDFNGYKIDNLSKYKMKIAVYYIDDTADYSKKNIFFNNNKKVTHDSNIKQIELNITDKNDKVFSIFRFESCNIGKRKVYSRDDL
jgi:type II secretory pathway pseudopilin PulG